MAARETVDEAGILGPRRLDLDLEKLGFGVTVFLGVKLATKGRVSLEDFERAVSAIPEVQTVEHVLGLYDYRLRVVARDLPDFERGPAPPDHDLPGAAMWRPMSLSSEERRPHGPLG
jgi:Lrp/AsnC family leucine-responsive transcriptional regulator